MEPSVATYQFNKKQAALIYVVIRILISPVQTVSKRIMEKKYILLV